MTIQIVKAGGGVLGERAGGGRCREEQYAGAPTPQAGRVGWNRGLGRERGRFPPCCGGRHRGKVVQVCTGEGPETDKERTGCRVCGVRAAIAKGEFLNLQEALGGRCALGKGRC